MGAKAEKREMFVTSPQFYRTIVLLSVPIILQQLLRVSVDTLDSIMLGRIDQVQMSAVSQAQQIFFIFYTVCSGFSAGCSVLIAQYWGRRDTESIKTLVAIGVRSIAVFGVLFSAVVMIWPGTAFKDIQQRSGADPSGSAVFKDRLPHVSGLRRQYHDLCLLPGI